MPKRDSPPDMVGRSAEYCPARCGWLMLRTPLDDAWHRVHHLEWAKPRGTASQDWRNLIGALKILVELLEKRESEQRKTICDLEEQVKDLIYDLEVATGRGNDYKAELDAIREGRHEA